MLFEAQVTFHKLAKSSWSSIWSSNSWGSSSKSWKELATVSISAAGVERPRDGGSGRSIIRVSGLFVMGVERRLPVRALDFLRGGIAVASTTLIACSVFKYISWADTLQVAKAAIATVNCVAGRRFRTFRERGYCRSWTARSRSTQKYPPQKRCLRVLFINTRPSELSRGHLRTLLFTKLGGGWERVIVVVTPPFVHFGKRGLVLDAQLQPWIIIPDRTRAKSDSFFSLTIGEGNDHRRTR